MVNSINFDLVTFKNQIIVIKLGDTSNYHYSPQNCHVFILMYRIYGIYFAYERIMILLANSRKILMHHQYIVIIL